MSNTYSPTLVTDSLKKSAITVLQNKFAPLRAFAFQVETDPLKPLATCQVKFVTSGSATLTDASDFEQGNSVVTNIPVTVHQYSQPFQVSNADLNNGLRLQDLGTVNAKTFASKIQQIVNAIITTANFTATPLTSAAGAFGLSDMATLFGQLKKSDVKNLILDGDYFARIINTPGYFQPAGTKPGDGWKPFGWDFIGENTEWTGAGAGVTGLACNPQAIAVALGLPAEEKNRNSTLQREIMTIPGLEIQVALYSWFSLATRTMWASYDLMLGAALGDATAGVIVKSS